MMKVLITDGRRIRFSFASTEGVQGRGMPIQGISSENTVCLGSPWGLLLRNEKRIYEMCRVALNSYLRILPPPSHLDVRNEDLVG